MTADPVSVADLAEALRAAGLRAGGGVLVHSSYKSLGAPVEDGPAGVVEAFLAAAGDEGTVLFPTLTGAAWMDREHPPAFDARATACWTGAVPEAARRHPRALRSLHPTHSVAALGRHASEYVEGHEAARTPCGPGTPYGRLVERGGTVLFLGVSLEACTLFHGFEEEAGVPYHLQAQPVRARVTDAAGRTREVETLLHWWNEAAPRRFEAAAPLLRERGALAESRVLGARALLLDAALAREAVVPRLRADPRFLLR
jgi:aminoglycoside 3-N-acetyltransferase